MCSQVSEGCKNNKKWFKRISEILWGLFELLVDFLQDELQYAFISTYNY